MSFIRNSWYMAAWSGDITDKPVAVTILNDPLVLFRGASATLGCYSTSVRTAPCR